MVLVPEPAIKRPGIVSDGLTVPLKRTGVVLLVAAENNVKNFLPKEV